MKRRDFLGRLVGSFLTIPLLVPRKSWSFEDWEEDDFRALKIWSYYVPLTSYDGIIDKIEGMNPLDRKVILAEVMKKTNRINGKETDGTKNSASFEIDQLHKAPEFVRVKFWHDDNGASGHTLHIFRRYLEDLEAGKNVFVATGTFQGHFHVVRIQAPA